MKALHSTLWAGTMLGIAGIFAAAPGCELVAGIDRSQIGSGGAGGASDASSSSSSSSSSGEAGAGGMGGMAGMAGMGGMGHGGHGGTAGMGGIGGNGTGGMGGAGGMGGMGGMGGGPVCTVVIDCPIPANECITAACVMGACVETNVAMNIPTTGGQMAGDCKQSVCDGNGAITSIDDATDTMTDNKACTKDQCANGMLTYPPEAVGFACMEGGGKVCDGAGTCVQCNVNADCMSNVCQNNVCQTAQCGDMTKNGTETDVDCGGTCGGCMDGKVCALPADCLSQVCTAMVCAVPTCMDMAKNGTETDVDCGGSCTADCADGKMCVGNGDCMSGFCNPMTNMCAAPTCMDGFPNGSETDTDCGGSCMTDCMNGDDCLVDGDCTSGYCNAMMVCAAPTCMDMAQNGNETDVDCGGPLCADCMNGDSCMVNDDCASTYCNSMMTCATPTCTDTIKNGTETDIDCGGACPDCMVGQTCTVGTDCTTGVCTAMTCAAATCTDGVQNGTETGIDCGGTCGLCLGAMCTSNTDCASTICHASVCKADVNGCTPGTPVAAPTVTFANGNFTYAPKCVTVTVGTVVTFNGNFGGHPHQGGVVSGGMEIPDTTGPFMNLTNTGTSMPFTMTTVGTFPYYCVPHGLGGMNGAVFVVP